MGFLVKGMLLTLLFYFPLLSQEDWNWEVIPPNPMEQDTIIITMSFLSGYNLNFESKHNVVNNEITIDVNVTSGNLPIYGWFHHADTLGFLKAGIYNCTINIDYYYWDMNTGQAVYEKSDSGWKSFTVQQGTFISHGKNHATILQEAQLQNHPNPFNNNTLIKYFVPTSGMVSLKLFDIRGQEILTIFYKYHKKGEFSIRLNASLLPSGMYICILSTENLILSKNMIILK